MTVRVPPVAERMTALEQLRAEKKLFRICQLTIGLLGYGTALAFLVQSALGVASWTVLSEGLAARSGLSFGWSVNVIAMVVLLLWIPLREMPGLGTFLNVVIVGLAADVALNVIGPPSSVVQQTLYFVVGLTMLTFFDALYLGARFGSGPRDGLMTGAVRLTRRPIWLIRSVIELTVLTVGWLLGGTIGVGTVIVAVVMGPAVQLFSKLLTVRLERDSSHSGEG
ncbi:membrane protein [Rhodococcoides trifolii]|uniref:Membrane protein n=1 Tax=Rhodococcoides trifolii TaxID=908250 RepID=A0A917G683_9NOCA|nr:hypothetical protein [Rhodococcus trifolii]GGG23877.1 membrane protein [Rhodococcus trifolii]